MKKVVKIGLILLVIISTGASTFTAPLQTKIASAHEVYVLDGAEINEAKHEPRPDFVDAIVDNKIQFTVSVGVAAAMLLIVSIISLNLRLRRKLSGFLLALKKAAPTIAQITLGASIFASGYFNAAFGIELPLASVFASHAHMVDELLMVLGALLVLGVLPRIAAAGVVIFFSIMVWKFGFYMLNYAIYFGEALAIVVFGAGYTLYKQKFLYERWKINMSAEKIHDYSFFLIRVLFGISLIFASLYAKFFYGALALDTVNKYHLTNFFPFEPSFVVLGAMITEVSIGLFIMLGIHVRFVNLLFLGFLMSSLLFFGESVWPHFVLIGTAIAVLLHGYDKNTLLMKLTKEKSYEPVL